MDYVEVINNLLSIDYLGLSSNEELKQKVELLAKKVEESSIEELINELGIKDFRDKLLEMELISDYAQKVMILTSYLNNLGSDLEIKRDEITDDAYFYSIINQFNNLTKDLKQPF